MACGLVLIGGAGLANGLGGPCAPADRRAPAEGEGGGKTTPCCPVCPLLGAGGAGRLEVLAAAEEAGWQIAAEAVAAMASVYLSPAEGEVKDLVSFEAAVDVPLKSYETFAHEVQGWADMLEARRTS
ncbi:hypothetical protein KC323_g251 [Hortaea werneckii]|nr:hypothetical protein KC323_g251 [Hortaea werneckii]